MRQYQQLSAEERFLIAALRSYGFSRPEIATVLGRDRTTIWRETRRNAVPYDGGYRWERAHERAGARRKRSRRNRQFTPEQFARVEALLKEKWSPEQISGFLRRVGEFSISHETIYRHVGRDHRRGGNLRQHLRGSRKQARKRYRSYDSRGRLAGKRHISQRPAAVETRKQTGHWEIDTVLGAGQRGDCVLTLVERKTGFLLMGKLRARTKEETARVTTALIRRHPGRFKTITSDNGTEFHCYREIEAATGVKFYFATPHHAWERGTSENTNGLIRQYLPKRTSMASLPQNGCDSIARKLNTRPRKRHGYQTPLECFSKP
jgi:IS30 family transposase